MATITTTAPKTQQPRFKLGSVVVIVGTVILLIFAFIEIVPFVLTIANSFKCQSAAQNAPGAIIPVPPGTTCFDEERAAAALHQYRQRSHL